MKRLVKIVLFPTLLIVFVGLSVYSQRTGFEFGPRTANPTSDEIKLSNQRHIRIASDIIYRRNGETGPGHDVPTVIDDCRSDPVGSIKRLGDKQKPRAQAKTFDAAITRSKSCVRRRYTGGLTSLEEMYRSGVYLRSRAFMYCSRSRTLSRDVKEGRIGSPRV